MDETKETTTVRFSCACQRVTGSAEVPNSKLPLPFTLCHCNICRHQTGLLCGSYVTLKEGTTNFKAEGPLTNYETSDIVTRCFCSHCGANVWLQYKREDRPNICSGALDKADGIIKLKNHIFVSDTKDGGLSTWIPDSDIAAWEGFSKENKQIDVTAMSITQSTVEHTTELYAHCQCKGVQFKITRPNQASKDLSSPWPDLVKPYHSESPENKEDVKWWLRADDTKYLAGSCACKSCRVASSFDIQSWAFVPKANILQLDEKPLDFGMGSLEQCSTAEGVHRNFCGKCGATVFWHCDERSDLVDVSVGLLDAEEGARAGSWLEWWTNRVSFEEAAQNKDLISRLGAGLTRWGNVEGTSSANGHNPLRPNTER